MLDVVTFIKGLEERSKGKRKFGHALDLGSSYVIYFNNGSGKHIMEDGIRFWKETAEVQVFNPMRLAADEKKAYQSAKFLSMKDLERRGETEDV